MSPPGHPTFAQLDRYLASCLTAGERPAVVRHVLTRCEICCAYLRHRLDPGPAPEPDPRHRPGAHPCAESSTAGPARPAAEAAEQAARDPSAEGPYDEDPYAEGPSRDRLLASSLWTALAGRSQAQRLRMVAQGPHFHEPSLVEHLIEVCRERPLGDPSGAREIAELARAVADRLAPMAHPEGVVADRRTAALANLGDAQRRCEDLAAARRSFAQAWRNLEEGSGDALVRPYLMRLEASFLLAVGDRERGLRRLRSATWTYRRCGEPHEQGRVVLQTAQAWGYFDPWRGVALAREALALIDARREPRLELSARHALTWFLNDGGAGREAFDLLESTRPLYRRIEGSQPRLCQQWLEARISRSLGDLAAAEETLKTVWRDFRNAGFNQDLTLVSLDLAGIFLAQGKTRHAVLLLRRFEPTLRLFKMHSHGMAAWLLLQEALATEAVRARSLLREAALYFRQAWRRPVPFRRRSSARSRSS